MYKQGPFREVFLVNYGNFMLLLNVIEYQKAHLQALWLKLKPGAQTLYKHHERIYIYKHLGLKAFAVLQLPSLRC